MEKKSLILKKEVIEAIKQVYDPELPVNVYDLGLIYDISVGEGSKDVRITMTLTTPSCPVAESLPQEVKYKVEQLTEAAHVEVILTFDPPYDVSLLSEEAKLALGML